MDLGDTEASARFIGMMRRRYGMRDSSRMKPIVKVLGVFHPEGSLPTHSIE
jgi:hypothetical protein